MKKPPELTVIGPASGRDMALAGPTVLAEKGTTRSRDTRYASWGASFWSGMKYLTHDCSRSEENPACVRVKAGR